MGVTVSLLEITREIWEDESFKKWISGGVEMGDIPEHIPDFREPRLSDIKEILEQFADINVEQKQIGGTFHIVFSKLIEIPIEVSKGVVFHRYYEYYDHILVTPMQFTIDVDSNPIVKVQIEKSSGERINKFIQLLSNRCGTFLLLEDGEPVQFFVPQTA